MIRADGVDHVFFQIRVVLCQFHALSHDSLHVGKVVCCVEVVIAWKYLAFYVGFELGVDHGVHHLLEGEARGAVLHVDGAAMRVA